MGRGHGKIKKGPIARAQEGVNSKGNIISNSVHTVRSVHTLPYALHIRYMLYIHYIPYDQYILYRTPYDL